MPPMDESLRREELELAPLVARVEEGSRLSDPDLDRLRAACARRPESADWWLCLAHALVNGDQAGEALRVLERAAALQPGAILVPLAQARALGALERYAEAEALLKGVLASSPAHADALRALALLRLRSGAPAEAAGLARRVLDTDPLDEEARQIAAEAEAAAAAPPASSGGWPLETELLRSLQGQGLSAKVDAASGAVSVALEGGRAVRLSLSSLATEARADPRGPGRHLDNLARSLARLVPPERSPDLAQVRGRIFPVLRPLSFLAATGPALGCEAPAGLRWLFALDDPEFVAYLPPAAAQRWGLSPEALLALAFENLERAQAAPSRYRAGRAGLLPAPSGPWDLLAFDKGDGYDASRLLSPAHRALLSFKGPFAAAIPTRSCALLAPLDRPKAMALLRVVAKAQADGPEGLCHDLFRLGEDGMLSRL